MNKKLKLLLALEDDPKLKRGIISYRYDVAHSCGYKGDLYMVIKGWNKYNRNYFNAYFINAHWIKTDDY